MEIKQVAISIPSEGHTLPEAYDNHLLLSFHLGKLQAEWKQQKRNPRYEFNWFTAGRIFTPMAREKLVSSALESKMDYILMYDDDMLLPINMVEWLLEDMEKNPEIDVLAPLAFMRSGRHYPVIYTTLEGYDEKRHESYYINQFVKDYPKDDLFECDAVGFGAVLIKMDMVKRMKPHYFFSTTGTGEDIYFCIKAKQDANARIFCDTRVKLGHLGNPVVIDEDYYLKTLKDNKEDLLDTPYKYSNYRN
jgi:hypothetical protein